MLRVHPASMYAKYLSPDGDKHSRLSILLPSGFCYSAFESLSGSLKDIESFSRSWRGRKIERVCLAASI